MSLKYNEKKSIDTGYIMTFLNPAHMTNECKLYYKNIWTPHFHWKYTTLIEYHFSFYVLHILKSAKENNDFHDGHNQYSTI